MDELNPTPPVVAPPAQSAAPSPVAVPTLAPAPAPAPVPSTGGKKTVMVAEDDVFLNKVYCHALQKEGFNVIFVKNGMEVLENIDKQVPDLLLLDLVMPSMDGFAVLEKLRAKPSAKNLKVIVLSNLGQDEDKIAVKKFGVTDYIVKSNAHITEIIGKIKAAIA